MDLINTDILEQDEKCHEKWIPYSNRFVKISLNDINVIFVVTSGKPSLDYLGIIFKHPENMPHLLEKDIFKLNLDISQLRLLWSKVLSLLRMHAI